MMVIKVCSLTVESARKRINMTCFELDDEKDKRTVKRARVQKPMVRWDDPSHKET